MNTIINRITDAANSSVQKSVSLFRSRKVLKIGLVLLITLIAFYLGSGLGGSGSSDPQEVAHEHDLEEKNGFWTCSMHPQIKLPKPGKCPICHMDLIRMESGNAGAGEENEMQLILSESAKRLSRIVTAEVVRRGGPVQVKMNGRITPDESRIAMISSRVGGRIDRLYVNITGSSVKKGDPLALLYSPELMAYQQELIAASVSLSRLGEGASELIRNSARLNLDAAKEKLRLLGFSSSDISGILSRGTPSEHMTIRAAQAGVVLERKVNEGDYVKEGMPLFHIADLSKVWAVMDGYETDLPHLQVGQKVNFTLSALPGESFSGRISFIDPVIDPVTRIARVRVDVNNKNRKLKPEMFLSAEVEPAKVTKVKEDAPIVIPSTAPLFTGERAIVYVEVGDNENGTVYEGKEIVLGPRMGDSYVVKSGLEEGERVVVHGAFRIDSELQIRAKPSMMSPNGENAGGAHAHHGAMPQKGAEKKTGSRLQPVKSSNLSHQFRKSIDDLYASYLDLGNALASDDQNEAAKAFDLLSEKISLVKAGDGEPYSVWEKARSALSGVLEHKDHYKNIEEKRDAFAKISEQVITLREVYGSMSDEHYLAFCPMAFNDKGAHWLQDKKQIVNPYFGESMLRCGEIKEHFSK